MQRIILFQPSRFFQIPSHSGKLALFVLNLFLSAQTVSAQQLDETSQQEVTVAQRQLIQKLSGQSPISGDEFITSRSTAAGRKQVANFLYSQLEEAGFDAKKHKYKVSNKLFILDLFFDPYMGTNVYTTIPATVPSREYVLLGAHFDTEAGSPGANDNATGIALLMEVARQLQAMTQREKHFIIVFFDQEEDGLIGSKAFAERLKDKNICLHSAHTVDMVGWDADGDRAVELEYPTEELKVLYQSVAAGLDIPLYETHVQSTDHTSFRELGFAAIGITEEYVNGDTTPHYHQATDTAETVNYEYLASTTELVGQVMKKLANTSNNNEL